MMFKGAITTILMVVVSTFALGEENDPGHGDLNQNAPAPFVGARILF